jgi:hypothetical protein
MIDCFNEERTAAWLADVTFIIISFSSGFSLMTPALMIVFKEGVWWAEAWNGQEVWAMSEMVGFGPSWLAAFIET